ncbi:MAG: hypothetical protein ABSA34_01815 [Candidatus Goldiibacteriota bacterium]|jgi:hypothetical protein
MGKICVLSVLLSLACGLVYSAPVDFKYLYSITKNIDKISAASVMQDGAKLIAWEDGKIISKDVFDSGSSWGKYMDFDPENFGIRFAQDDGSVKLVKPVNVSAICYNPAAKRAALLMHLNNANSVISICDMSKNRQIYTCVVRTHPAVPGRKVEFMAIDRINLVPFLSDEALTAAWGVYTYLYKNSIELVDIQSGKVSEIKNAAIPFIWKDRVYYLDMTNPEKKTFLLKTALLDGTKQEKFTRLDFEPGMFMMQRGVLYTINGTKIYALRIGKDEKFTEIADSASILAGPGSPALVRIFPVVHESKELMIFIVKITKENKEQLLVYSKEL